MALASWNPVCQSTDSQAAVGSIVVHTSSCLVAWYRNIQSNKYDGVHMYGPSGEKAYTASVLNILSSAQLVVVKPPKYYDEYKNQSYKQGRYQAKAKNTNRRQAQNKMNRPNNNMAGNYQDNRSQYAVPTHNRFSQLGDFFPKN